MKLFLFNGHFDYHDVADEDMCEIGIVQIRRILVIADYIEEAAAILKEKYPSVVEFSLISDGKAILLDQ